jgi:hypothetical protein
MANVVTFVLLSLGSIMLLGLLGSWFPSIHHTAMVVGGYAITGANLIFVGLACFVVWVSAQV